MSDTEWRSIKAVLLLQGNTRSKSGTNPTWDMRLIPDAIFYLIRGRTS